MLEKIFTTRPSWFAILELNSKIAFGLDFSILQEAEARSLSDLIRESASTGLKWTVPAPMCSHQNEHELTRVREPGPMEENGRCGCNLLVPRGKWYGFTMTTDTFKANDSASRNNYYVGAPKEEDIIRVL